MNHKTVILMKFDEKSDLDGVPLNDIKAIMEVYFYIILIHRILD